MHINDFFIKKFYKKLQIDNVSTVFSLIRDVNPPQTSKKNISRPYVSGKLKASLSKIDFTVVLQHQACS